MANNVTLKNAAGTTVTAKTTDTGGVHTPHHNVDVIAAGDNNIGNVDIVSLPAGNVGMQEMAASVSVVPANNITDATYIGDIKFGEALPAGTAVIGATQDAGPGAGAGTMQTPFHGDASTAQDVSAAPTAGQKVVVTDIFISAAAAAEVHLEEETSGTTIFGPVFMAANTAYQFTPRGKLKLATADKKVKVHSSTADHITCQISAVSEA